MSQYNPEKNRFVRVSDYISHIIVDLKYATTENFTGKPIYSFSEAWLRYGTVQKLATVQAELQKLGYGLKIWDAFRPVAAQFALWEVRPNPVFIANPYAGYSNHSRGNAVDVTLVDLNGYEVVMPTEFDSLFDIQKCQDLRALEAAKLLHNAMTKAGFKALPEEWWHFTDEDSYAVEKEFIPK